MTAEAQNNTRVPKASDVLANLLKVRILGEGLAPGDRLPPEADLIEQYGFSRGTVRESLRMLETDGIVAVRRGPRGGIEVTRPDVSRVTRLLAVLLAFDGTPVSDLVEFRLIIEPGAAAMAARQATAEQRDALVAMTMEEHGDVPHSVDFHRLLGVATNNYFTSTVLTTMNQVLEWQTNSTELSGHQRTGTSAAHRSIAAAVKRGDEAKASRIMRAHILEFKEVLAAQGRLDQPVVPRPSAGSPPRAVLY
ncbi:FCD domain-containing protein [Mycolicibacterium goodii]|uniref:FadR/GntR family transcriptional regulator n=1 Tax=Mycolicibacterium goodii TaxID=134601 RepID=UPI001BDBBF2E|nr:FCD domain-containing protein [Mycolicibacterium goodii]MBU8808188.1 FCD domain-containing protein [Mycolicibacterium goodii]